MLPRDLVRGLLGVERREHDAALARGEHLEAAREPLARERLRRGIARASGAGSAARSVAAAPGADGAPASWRHVDEDEGSELIRLAQAARAEPRDHGEEDVLREVGGRGLVAQVAQAVEPHARAEPPAERVLGRAVAQRRAPGKLSIRTRPRGRWPPLTSPSRGRNARGTAAAADAPSWRRNGRRRRGTSGVHARRSRGAAKRGDAHDHEHRLRHPRRRDRQRASTASTRRWPSPAVPGGFTFNQYLVVDEEPLLFHTGPRRMFPLVARGDRRACCPSSGCATSRFSHFEADECGALNEFLAAAPSAVPLCGQVAAMVSVNDFADRAAAGARRRRDARARASTRVRWLDTPHVPHGWECGFLFETETRTLFCGDLFTQGGAAMPPLTETDILGPSEAFRAPMDYFAHAPNAARAARAPRARRSRTTLACMHGSAWRGDGAALLRALADALASSGERRSPPAR